MPQYGSFDHTVADPKPITGWWDTDAFAYASLPGTVDRIQLSTDQWTNRMTAIFAVQAGLLVALPPPPPTLAQQANALLNAPVDVTCTSIPTLNGPYAVDAVTQGQMTAITSGINSGLGLPGGGDTFNWPDTNNIAHPWPAPQFMAFAQGARNFAYACGQVIQGHSTTLPPATITIA